MLGYWFRLVSLFFAKENESDMYQTRFLVFRHSAGGILKLPLFWVLFDSFSQCIACQRRWV